jgi:hypothetical protein
LPEGYPRLSDVISPLAVTCSTPYHRGEGESTARAPLTRVAPAILLVPVGSGEARIPCRIALRPFGVPTLLRPCDVPLRPCDVPLRPCEVPFRSCDVPLCSKLSRPGNRVSGGTVASSPRTREIFGAFLMWCTRQRWATWKCKGFSHKVSVRHCLRLHHLPCCVGVKLMS